MRRRTVSTACAILILGAAAREASAATIAVSSLILPGASSAVVGPVTTTAPNNDPANFASPNVVPYSIHFDTVGPVDISFATRPSGGTTEYLFLGTALMNGTGQAWTDYHFELGTGLGAAFEPWFGAVAALDFDTPDASPAPTSSVFPLLTHQPHTLDWSGGTVYPLGSGQVPVGVNFSFSVDVPDQMTGFFTLRQYPTVAAVPEPASALLLFAGLGLAVAVRFRRQQR